MNEELKDIKDLVEIPDISFLVFIFVVGLVVTILGVLIYLFLRAKKRKKPTKKEILLKQLQELDFNNAKISAYTFTKNAHPFLDETNQKRYNDICEKLEVYKYKKEIPSFDKNLEDEIREFVSELHVK